MGERVDVAIIGGGAASLSLASALAGRRRVAVIEAEAATGYHSPGRSAAVFTERFPGSPVAALAHAARGFLEHPPEGFASAPLLRRRGNLIVADADNADRLCATLAAERVAAPRLRALGVTPHRRTAIIVDAAGVDVTGLPMVDALDEAFQVKPDAGRLLVSPADETPSVPCDARPEEIDVARAMRWLETASTLKPRRPAAQWAGLRSFTADRAPAIGFSAHAPGFFWLVGQGGHGVLSSPAAARLAAGRICGETDDGVFSPRRLGG